MKPRKPEKDDAHPDSSDSSLFRTFMVRHCKKSFISMKSVCIIRDAREKETGLSSWVSKVSIFSKNRTPLVLSPTI